MSKHLPWYKRAPSDWSSGTRGMSLELRGFYSEFLDAQWLAQGQLPKDAKWLALAFQCSTRMVRSLMPKLIAAGKVIETQTGYYNPRMMADILGLDQIAPCGQFAPQSSTTRAPVEHEPSAKIPENPMFSTRDLEAEAEAEAENPENAGARDPIFLNGSRLEISPEFEAELREEFPLADIGQAAIFAVPEARRLSRPSQDDLTAVLRKAVAGQRRSQRPTASAKQPTVEEVMRGMANV